jgi:hypothetical protein
LDVQDQVPLEADLMEEADRRPGAAAQDDGRDVHEGYTGELVWRRAEAEGGLLRWLGCGHEVGGGFAGGEDQPNGLLGL